MFFLWMDQLSPGDSHDTQACEIPVTHVIIIFHIQAEQYYRAPPRAGVPPHACRPGQHPGLLRFIRYHLALVYPIAHADYDYEKLFC